MKIENFGDVQNLVRDRQQVAAELATIAKIEKRGEVAHYVYTSNESFSIPDAQAAYAVAILALVKQADEAEIKRIDARLKELGVEVSQ